MFKTPSTIGRSFLGVAALATFAMGAQAGLNEFKADVNAAIDAGIQYSRNNGLFTSELYGGYGYSTGLSLLTLLEKESIPAGYNGLSPADKSLAQNAACILIDSGNFGDRGSFYSYYDGQVLMALSVYLETGGPDQPAAPAGYNCTGRSARATIDKVVDRSIAAQTPGVPAVNNSAGYWGYSGNGLDSSTTQFTLAGLSAAKGFYASMGESLPLPLSGARIASITATLDKTSAAYALHGKASTGIFFDTCGANGCVGHGYQASYGAANNSSQQTASGAWGQLSGSGKNVNDPSIQSYLRWLQNAYNYNTNVRPDQWVEAYFYYLWSSSKTFNIIQNAGVAATSGNIDPAAMGTLPAHASGRLVNRDPAVDTRPAPRGGGAAGYYGGTPKGWYYDYAYRLMSVQNGAGQFLNSNGSWDRFADHAYAILVLQRSLGGACVDTDGDGVCDSVDNCPSVFNPGQEDTYGDKRGDACEPRVVATCDLNSDGAIDSRDIAIITALRNKPASANPMADIDGNGIININDARACVLKCTRPNCATQ